MDSRTGLSDSPGSRPSLRRHDEWRRGGQSGGGSGAARGPPSARWPGSRLAPRPSLEENREAEASRFSIALVRPVWEPSRRDQLCRERPPPERGTRSGTKRAKACRTKYGKPGGRSRHQTDRLVRAGRLPIRSEPRRQNQKRLVSRGTGRRTEGGTEEGVSPFHRGSAAGSARLHAGSLGETQGSLQRGVHGPRPLEARPKLVVPGQHPRAERANSAWSDNTSSHG